MNRIHLLYIVILLSAGFLASRLFFVQVVRADYYNDRADRQYQRPPSRLGDRGSIFFREKSGQIVPAATTRDGFLLAVNPKLITDTEIIYEKLNSIIAIDHTSFDRKVSRRDDPYEIVVEKVEPEIAHKIAALELPGVIIDKSHWRVYPAERLASHVIGFMAYEGDTLAGRYGVERYYNGLLTHDENKSFVSFLADTFAGFGGEAFGQAHQTAGNIILTIEPTVQGQMERELFGLKEMYKIDSAGGVIMDPQNGELLALAALPNFSPGERQSDIAVLSNPLVENVYEMGSIVKPLTMAAALDAGVVTPRSTYFDYGSVTLSTKKIANYDGRAHGKVTMQEVLNQSLNTGAVFAMQQLGQKRFSDYFHNFGLGESTGVDLPGETKGLLRNLDSDYEVDYATASFGQGIAVTPLAMARAAAALGNGGKLVTPHVVAQIQGDILTVGDMVDLPPPKQVLKSETSEEISRMLVRVVDEALAGGAAKLDHYNVAAKTGTAQVPDPTGGYYSDRYLHSFFGYFPAYQPRFLVFMYIVNPQGVRYASETLTEPFMRLTKFLLNYYNVAPDR